MLYGLTSTVLMPLQSAAWQAITDHLSACADPNDRCADAKKKFRHPRRSPRESLRFRFSVTWRSPLKGRAKPTRGAAFAHFILHSPLKINFKRRVQRRDVLVKALMDGIASKLSEALYH